MSLDIDYYELLQVDRSADDKALKSAYRKLAMQYHPDRNPGCSDSEARFKAISEAYDCLKDPQKRAAYDRFGKDAFRNGGFGANGGGADFGDIGDIFESIFGSAFGGGRQQRGPARGADLRYDMEIRLEDAFTGCRREIQVDVAARCDTCDGSGAKPGTHTHRCSTCGGHGKVRAQQGFFMVERVCPTCQGAGEVIADPCGTCLGEGRRPADHSGETADADDDCGSPAVFIENNAFDIANIFALDIMDISANQIFSLERLPDLFCDFFGLLIHRRNNQR